MNKIHVNAWMNVLQCALFPKIKPFSYWLSFRDFQKKSQNKFNQDLLLLTMKEILP